MIQILHNPRCSKSREGLELLTQSGKEFEVINYLKNSPSAADLQILINKLGVSPIEVVRQKEPLWISNFKNQSLSDSEIVQILADNPILIERPIIVNGNKAVIARPIEKAKSII